MKTIVALFPGSGSQYVGMSRSLYEDYRVVKDTFDEANDILNYDLKKIILEGSIFKLNRVQNTLLAVYVVSVAYFRAYMKEISSMPQYMAGHSLGEYSALTCSGIVEFQDCLKLIRYRSELAEEVSGSSGGTMTILKNIVPSVVKDECLAVSSTDSPVFIACYNSPSQVLISGEEEAVRAVELRLLDKLEKVEVINLVSSPPYHSALMRQQSEKLKEALDSIRWNTFQSQVISNVDAKPYTNKQSVVDNLTMQMYCPVRWQATIEYFNRIGVGLFIEIGPQNVLKNIQKEISGAKRVYAFDELVERSVVIKMLKNDDSREAEQKERRDHRLRVLSLCLMHAVSTKNNSLSTEYEQVSLQLYDHVLQLKKTLEGNGEDVTTQHIEEAFTMLKAVFKTKKTPLNEQEKRFEDIAKKTNIWPQTSQKVH